MINGLVLPRSMMAHWVIKIQQYYLETLWELMMKQMKEKCELLHIDETTTQVNKEPGRKAHTDSYMWVMTNGELEQTKGVVYQYEPSRSAETAQKFLKGYKGIIVTDGYASYNNIADVTHAECWSHCRRYFKDSIPIHKGEEDTSSLGYKGEEYCNRLFKIEREIADLSVPEKQKEREKRSKPVLDEFFAWVHTVLEKELILTDKLSKALKYASNQQKELSEFLNDGRIPLSNNKVERAIRPFAISRKNWLFSDSVDGAKANAVYYSLIESAKLNNLNIYKYITYLLEAIPQLDNPSDEKILQKYLPWSDELPEDILNFQGTYKELEIESDLIVEK